MTYVITTCNVMSSEMIPGGGFPCLPILRGFSHGAKTGGKANPYFRLTTTADDDAVTWLTNYGTV